MKVIKLLKFLVMLPSMVATAVVPRLWASQYERHYLHGSEEPTDVVDYLQRREQERATIRKSLYGDLRTVQGAPAEQRPRSFHVRERSVVKVKRRRAHTEELTTAFSE